MTSCVSSGVTLNITHSITDSTATVLALLCDGVPYVAVMNGLHLCDPCKYMEYIYQLWRDGRLSWLTHSGQLTNRVVTCQLGVGQQKSASQRRHRNS